MRNKPSSRSLRNRATPTGSSSLLPCLHPHARLRLQQQYSRRRYPSPNIPNPIPLYLLHPFSCTFLLIISLPRPPPCLRFVGPPGVGKTSLGQSITCVLALLTDLARDEAEICAHRRTYVASGPGPIVQVLPRVGHCDPVVMPDETDKVGQRNFHGDHGVAFLEVLDPEQ